MPQLLALMPQLLTLLLRQIRAETVDGLYIERTALEPDDFGRIGLSFNSLSKQRG